MGARRSNGLGVGAAEGEELGVDDLVIEHGAVERAVDAVIYIV
jgi:hypothetical protein